MTRYVCVLLIGVVIGASFFTFAQNNSSYSSVDKALRESGHYDSFVNHYVGLYMFMSQKEGAKSKIRAQKKSQLYFLFSQDAIIKQSNSLYKEFVTELSKSMTSEQANWLQSFYKSRNGQYLKSLEAIIQKKRIQIDSEKSRLVEIDATIN